VECNTGSLGHGLSIACGIAAGLKIDGSKAHVYCVVGDGESAEGQIWEAGLSAAHYKLDNLVAILDQNRLQATGAIEKRFNTNPMIEKWQSFGWHVVAIDGHSIGAILRALDDLDAVTGKPKMLVARTIKGAGLPFAENNAAYHNGAITAEQFEQARVLFGDKVDA